MRVNLCRYLFWGFLMSILSTPLHCAHAADNFPIFNNLKVRDGLPVHEIFTIAQDSDGFMWLGTIDGLIRYDGYEMKVFHKGRDAAFLLPDNQITDLVADGQNGLWVGSYKGLIHLNTHNGTTRLIDLGGSREVRCLLPFNDSILWVGTSEGLFKYNQKTGHYVLYNEENSKLGSNIVRALYADSRGQLWVGTFNGLNRISPDGSFLHFNLKGSYKPELKNNLILDIKPFEDKNDSKLWIGTETGLVLFDVNSFVLDTYNQSNTAFSNEVVKCIFPLSDGRVYFGTDFGFHEFDLRSRNVQVATHDPFNNFSLANNVVWDIYQDQSGIVWLATANGISQIHSNLNMFRFTPVYDRVGNQSVGNQVNDLYVDRKGTQWLATKKGVIELKTNGQKRVFLAEKQHPHALVLDNINTITGDHLGRIWIGSAGGINVWDGHKMHTITANFELGKGLRSNYISAFVTPSDGSFWVCTWGGGMYRAKGNFNKIEDIYFEYIGDFNTNIFAIEKQMWLFYEDQVFTLDLSTQQIKSIEKLRSYTEKSHVTALLATSNSDLWLGLNNQLIRYNIGNESVDVFDIFPAEESTITNLIEDFNGDLWGTTLTTIFKFSVQTGQVEIFSANKGIPMDIFLPQSCARDFDGALYFGGNDGFISFNPAEIKKDTYVPRTFVTRFRVGNRSIESFNQLKGSNKDNSWIPYAQQVVLKYDQRSFAIEFASLHFGDPKRNMYAYKLEGADDEWVYTSGNQNVATYSNLEVGKYTFRVKGTNNDGVWFENEALLQISVKPPFWASPWAIVLYIILLQIFLFMLISVYRSKALWKDQLQQYKLERDKNEAVAKAKQQFFTNVSHEFRTPLNLILGPVQALLERPADEATSHKMLQLVWRNSKRLLSLVNQLLDLQKVEGESLRVDHQATELVGFCRMQFEMFSEMAESKHIDYQFATTADSYLLMIDQPKLESIIQNLLSNALKFTSNSGRVHFSLDIIEDQKFIIEVSDSGAGISDADRSHIFERFYQGSQTTTQTSGTGIGLNLTREYCERMNGSIDFESEVGKGSRFWIELPLLKVADQIPVPKYVQLPEPDKKPLLTNTADTSLPCVLVVDDHVDTVEFIRLNLSQAYRVLVAMNGKEGLNLLSKQKVDLVLSDVMMPEMDGLSLCQQIKAKPQWSSIPVVLLTAMSDDSDQVKGLRAGADAYLTKPFSIHVLKARIDNLLQRNRNVDRYIKKQLIVENQEVTVDSHSERLLQETIQFIHKNITDTEINIDKMCKEIGLSHSNLYRKIKQQTGLSLNELIRQVKMKRAAQMIKAKNRTIAEVMYETGFTNHSYFAKCFKKEFGVSPREYAETDRPQS